MRCCTACPRHCAVDRACGERGYCGCGQRIRVAKWMLHMWEEPCVSGPHPARDSVTLPLPDCHPRNADWAAQLQPQSVRGSGAIFFCGCNLGCVYCQNREISRPGCTLGKEYSTEEIADMLLATERYGAYNCNLVTPTPYLPWLREAISLAKARGLSIPVVWNTGGYEDPDAIDSLAGLVDIYLTDWKYMDPALSTALSGAPDYGEILARVYPKMAAQVGSPVYDADGLLRRGVILRHLVLPGYRADSMAILQKAASLVPPQEVILSLMRQYTPDFGADADVPRSLHRRVTSFEYRTVLASAAALGYDGYSQDAAAASAGYTPEFRGK